MATFVEDSSEEEQCLDLVSFISKVTSKGKETDESFEDQCSSLVTAKEYGQVLDKIINEFDTVFSLGSEKEIQDVLYITLALAKKLAGAALDGLILKLVNKLSANFTEEKSLLRIKLINAVYTIMGEDYPNLCQILLALIQAATQTKHIDYVLSLPNIRDFKETNRHLKEWEVDLQQQREVFKSIGELYKKINRSKETHKWMTKYLSTFTNETDEKEIAAIQSDALQAAILAIKLPDLYQFDDLLELYPIKQLEKSNPKVLQLLKIFVSENLDAFNAFVASNPDFLESMGLNKEECTNKMRYLSLATLGAANSRISYATIAKALHIDETEVEDWIVGAMSDGILDAKMDQMKGIVIINRCLQRVFTKSQWQQLSDRLTTWTSNVELLLKTVHEVKLNPHQFQEPHNTFHFQTAAV